MFLFIVVKYHDTEFDALARPGCLGSHRIPDSAVRGDFWIFAKGPQMLELLQ